LREKSIRILRRALDDLGELVEGVGGGEALALENNLGFQVLQIMQGMTVAVFAFLELGRASLPRLVF